MHLTPEQLQRIFPGLPSEKCQSYAPHLNAALEEAGINTRRRACAFLAQLGHESQDLLYLKEIWGNTSAQKRYDVRVDLGNTPARDEDGKFYMGRGGLQRTGRANYERFQVATGVPVLMHPELLEKPEFAFRSDALYWTDHKLNRTADHLTLKGDHGDLATFDKLTRAINGGYNGRVDRQRRYLDAIETLPDDLFHISPFPAPLTVPKPPPPGTKPASDETKPPIDGTIGGNLVSKLSANETVKTAGPSVAKRLAVRLGRPLALLWTTLEAGNIYAWLGVAVFVLGLAFVIYYERYVVRSFIERIVK